MTTIQELVYNALPDFGAPPITAGKVIKRVMQTEDPEGGWPVVDGFAVLDTLRALANASPARAINHGGSHDTYTIVVILSQKWTKGEVTE